MRPVRRGGSPQARDFDDYEDAKHFLISRLGHYCSYCERRIAANLAVEHIQPKGLAKYAHLEGRWDNFLLACVNCNSTKANKDVILSDVLLPDRDNTFDAYTYSPDGTVSASLGISAPKQLLAKNTLSLTGLDKPIHQFLDENGKRVAIDRVEQRLQAWMLASDAVSDLAANAALAPYIVKVAKENGFFSIWLTAFSGNPVMRELLINAFSGTAGSQCFHPITTLPSTPAPNPDGLPDGGKA